MHGRKALEIGMEEQTARVERMLNRYDMQKPLAARSCVGSRRVPSNTLQGVVALCHFAACMWATSAHKRRRFALGPSRSGPCTPLQIR